MKRRDFLKLAGITGAMTAAGCGREGTYHLIPFLHPPEDIVPGKATWFAGTCRQCPAGCGVLGRNRETRLVKLEGNPLHPVNKGKLCARGQAGLQDLYSPDRLTRPTTGRGAGAPVSWGDALARLNDGAGRAAGKIAVLSRLENGYAADLFSGWLGRHGAFADIVTGLPAHPRATGPLYCYEPIHYEAVREGHRLAFGVDAIPTYNLSRCDFILSAGADFLETWISPVEFARQFAAARDPKKKNARFVYAGPRMSLTAANADRWVPVSAGGEASFLFAIVAALLESGAVAGRSAGEAKVAAAPGGRSAEQLAEAAKVEPGLVRSLAARIARARRPIVLADGSADAVVAADLIMELCGSAGKVMHFGLPHALSAAARDADLAAFVARMAAGEIKVLLVHKTNPVYSLPGFAEALAKVPLVVALDSIETETTAAADLVLPIHTDYETWGTYSPRPGVVSLVQPGMGPLGVSRPLEAVLAAPDAPVTKDEAHLRFAEYAAPKLGLGTGYTAELRGRLADGVVRGPRVAKTPPIVTLAGYSFAPARPKDEIVLLAYPQIHRFDGRDANKNWMMEIPDPLTNITWDGWVEVHPDAAEARGIADGDVLTIATPHGEAKLAAHLYPGLAQGTIAVPMGLGHANYGRYGTGVGANTWALTRGAAYVAATIAGTMEKARVAHTDGSKVQHHRDIARTVEEGREHEAVHGPAIPLRIPTERYPDPARDIYPPHTHDGYRWGMVVDLDRCTGCSACVAACYAENNIAVVGKERILQGRELSWLHIERYFDEEATERPRVLFIPMMCQHCDAAPCEPVCPVFAPHHDREGVNNQVYNRCVGTRYCSQNCPYKVRRFNWFTYRFEAPLEMQLNPDVTVRNKGVMEKCSFCIQRIKAAHQVAKVEGRTIRDGEVVPACVQTCPTGALHFGSYLDERSRIMRLVKDEKGRAYQVLDELNTKPGVIYLKKILRGEGGHTA
jgi:molybdopterin-containing oxidoreductase family iron-sulfur binding subunit